ncbi:hypothetical protein Q7P37_000646 [Cladosporium fusiforme]
MTGRGKGRLLHPDPNPSVKIGISLSTSPAKLSASSEEPFHVVITARILESPQPDRPITLMTHLSPLHGLHTRAFENIKCVSDETKHVEIWPRNWPQYQWDSEDIPRTLGFATIPSQGNGTYVVKHQIPFDAIRDAKVEAGESYRVKLTDLCLGTLWWCFGASEDLEAQRLCAWQDTTAETEEDVEPDPELEAEIERERREKYGDRRVLHSENPAMLAMVPEVGEMEFDVM